MLSSISGTVWQDWDKDGAKDVGEPGHAGVRVYLDQNRNGKWDEGEMTQISGGDGSYLFSGLSPGTYYVAEEVPAGWTQTRPNAVRLAPYSINVETGPTFQESSIPQSCRSLFDPQDIIQTTYTYAFQAISTFRPIGPDCFYHWLGAIADNRLDDAIKTEARKKRGGGKAPLNALDSSSATSILNLLFSSARSPSQSAASHEAIAALGVALAALKPLYRQVIQLRYIDSLSVAQVADRLHCSQGAVHMLCRRAKQRLHDLLGNTSAFFT